MDPLDEEGSLLESPDMKRVTEIIKKNAGKAGPLMPVLQELQKEVGYLSPEVLTEVAKGLKIEPSKVYGVATFYTLFSTTQKGKHIIRVCESAPCHVLKAQAIIKAVEETLGVCVGGTTADRQFTLEVASCLGVCGVGPAMEIDGEVYGNLTPEQIPAIIRRYETKAAVGEGAQR
jgi:NADH:ubiquinone oxidoreductase subunit E